MSKILPTQQKKKEKKSGWDNKRIKDRKELTKAATGCQKFDTFNFRVELKQLQTNVAASSSAVSSHVELLPPTSPAGYVDTTTTADTEAAAADKLPGKTHTIVEQNHTTVCQESTSRIQKHSALSNKSQAGLQESTDELNEPIGIAELLGSAVYLTFKNSFQSKYQSW